MTNTWYALQVRAQTEMGTAKDLRAEGYTVFLPVEEVVRTVQLRRGCARRRQPVEMSTIRPLVSSYLFCDVPVTSHKHVYGVIMHDEVPYRIPHTQMLPLFKESGRVRREGQVLATISIGQVVRLEGGPFDGKAVTIAKQIEDRFVVQMQMLGGPREITVARDQIAA